MALPEDPEDFLPQVGPQPLPYFVSGPSYNPAYSEPLTGVQKYVGQAVRGASLGFLGDPRPAETWGQTGAEMLGMAAPTIATMGIATPAAAAIPALRTFPIAQRIVAGAASGAAMGGVHAANTGGHPLQEAVIGGLMGAAGELGWAAWAKRARGRSAAETTVENVDAYSRGASPTTPVVGPATHNFPENLRPTPVPMTPRPEIEVGPGGVAPARPRMEMELGGGGTYGEVLEPRLPQLGPPSPGVGGARAQMMGRYPYDAGGATQLELADVLTADGRINRYAAPMRYRGTFPTSQVAILEADMTAARAIQEGVQTVRVTTTVQPPGGGPPTAGMIRVYKNGPNGAELVSEKSLNMTAAKAAQAGASPMRRTVHDYFEVQYNEKLGEDILIPRFPQVEDGLQIAMGIDPRERSIPLSLDQIGYLQSQAGRNLRQQLDIQAKIPKLDDVLKMTEEEAKRALIDTDKAPPLMAGAVVRPSDAAIRARATMTQLQMTDDEFRGLVRVTESMTPRDRMDHVMGWLRRRCAGG